MYGRITEISELRKIEYMKGKKQMSVDFPTLGKLDFILKHFAPKMSIDDFDFLIEKISLIHQLKLQYILSQ